MNILKNFNIESLKPNLIVGIDEVLWDMLPEGKKLGGAPANFAYHVSQLGLNSCIVSAVGFDDLGEEILNSLDGKGIDMLVEQVCHPTGTVQVTLDEAGIPQYEIKEGVAWDNIPFMPAHEAVARNARAVCFGSLAQRSAGCRASRESIRRFLEVMPKGAGYYRIFDINLRQQFYTKEIVHESLEKCNILKINDEELTEVARMFDLPGISMADRCWILMAIYKLEILILTCGVNGSYVYTPHGVSFIDTPKVQVVDTVGAGDSFTAAFVAALLRGLAVEEAHRLAVDVSAFVCTQNGAMPALPESLLCRIR